MFWKKNAFSYFIWAVYTIIVGTLWVFVTMTQISRYDFTEQLAVPVKILLVVLPVVLIFALVSMLHKYVLNYVKPDAEGMNTHNASEKVKVLIIMLLGIAVLYHDADIYFEKNLGAYNGALVSDGVAVAFENHGATYMYMLLLRFCFTVFGNKVSVAYGVQACLYFITAFLFYIAFRREAGRGPSQFTLAVFLLAPFVQENLLMFGPNLLYMAAYFLVLYILSGINSDNSMPLMRYICAGLLSAWLIYMDILGITLVFWAVTMLFLRSMDIPTAKNKRGLMLGYILGLLWGLIAIFLLLLVYTGKPFDEIMLGWINSYIPDSFRFGSAFESAGRSVLAWLTSAMLLINIFSFWFRKKTDRMCSHICLLAFVVLAEIFGISLSAMNYNVWIFVFAVLVAFIGLFSSMDLTDKAYLVSLQNAMLQAEQDEAEGIQKDKDANATEVIKASASTQNDTDSVSEKTQKQDKAVLEKKHKKNESRKRFVSKDMMFEPAVNEQEEKKTEPVKKEEAKPQEEDKSQFVKKSVVFLESPLPGPKKHVKKVMDYDIDVADDDDYDY